MTIVTERDANAVHWYFIADDIGKVWNQFMEALTSSNDGSVIIYPDMDSAEKDLISLAS